MLDLTEEEIRLLKLIVKEYNNVRLGRRFLHWLGTVIAWCLGIGASLAMIYGELFKGHH